MGFLTFFKGEGSTYAMIMVGKLKDKPGNEGRSEYGEVSQKINELKWLVGLLHSKNTLRSCR